ncbi:MAG: cell division protein FtsA [Pseudomonadota bacterium]
MSLFGFSADLPRFKGLSNKRPTTVSVLDVGSSKICCLIGRLRPKGESELLPGRTHRIEILGIGHHRSRGIKSGVIVDLDAAEQSIRTAVDGAERMAGLTVESLLVNVSCGRLASEAFSVSVDLGGNDIEDVDIRRVLEAGSAHAMRDGRLVVHSIPIGYNLDSERGIRDPRGMFGNSLGVDMHVVDADTAPLRNLEHCINRSHLSVEAMVASPYASGLSTLVDDESEMGCACVDMGGGTTTLSIFVEGQLVHADAIAVGGNHVTMDMARALSTRLEDAERLKVLQGSALPSISDERDIVSVPPIGEDDRDVANQIPRAQLTRVIRPRIEETLEMVRDRLNASGFAATVGKRVVLTGGASQLNGLSEVARRVLARNVRLGRPMGIKGLPEAARGPAFSTAVGLMIYPQTAQIEHFAKRRAPMKLTGTGGAFSRVSQWLRESF